MHKVFGILSLAAFVAAFGCSGGNSTTPTGKPAPSTTDGTPKPVATGGNVKPVATEGNTKPSTGASGAITPENTKIEFIGSKPGGKHDGGFKKFSGTLKPVGDDITKSTINIEIDIDSLWTDDDGKLNKLTGHLKSPDFFDAKKYPTATFASKEIKADKTGDTTHVINGDLTFHGTTKPVAIPVKVTTTDDSVTIDGKFTIDRTEFGMAFDPTKVNKEVTIKVLAKVSRK